MQILFTSLLISKTLGDFKELILDNSDKTIYSRCFSFFSMNNNNLLPLSLKTDSS